jgi:hypothetical protein
MKCCMLAPSTVVRLLCGSQMNIFEKNGFTRGPHADLRRKTPVSRFTVNKKAQRHLLTSKPKETRKPKDTSFLERFLDPQCPCCPGEPPPSPLHGKPRSAHWRLPRGGRAPNRLLIAAQSFASASRGELLRRLSEHRPTAHSCTFPASFIIRARRP